MEMDSDRLYVSIKIIFDTKTDCELRQQPCYYLFMGEENKNIAFINTQGDVENSIKTKSVL